MKRSLVLALVAACLAAPLAAQSLWPRRLEGTAEFGLEWVRPSFDGADGYTFGRGIWIVDARLQAGKRLNFVAALPRVVATTDAGGSSAFGNIYFGVEFTDTTGRPEFSLGLRKGSVGNDDDGVWEMGLYGDFDRVEQIFPQGFSISGIGHTRPWRSEDGAFAELRFGATVVASEGGGGMFLDYGIRIGRDGEKLGAGFAWTGRWAMGSGGGSLASTIDQLTLDLSLQQGPVRPSLAVRLPFDDILKESLDYALIFGVRVPLK